MDPFSRASKLARTPTKAEPPDPRRTQPEEEEPPTTEETIVIEHEEPFQFPKGRKGEKRKELSITPEKTSTAKRTEVEESPTNGTERKFAKVVDLARELEEMAQIRYSNTKTEIKVTSEKLKNRLEELFEAWVTSTQTQKKHRELLLAELNAHKKENKELKQQIEILETLGKKIDTKKLENLLENINSAQDVEYLVELQWPEKALKKAKTTTRSILTQANNRVLIVNENNTKDREIITRMSALYPTLGKTIKKTAIGKKIKLTIKEDIVEADGEEPSDPLPAQQITLVKIAESSTKEIILATKYCLDDLRDGTEPVSVYLTQDIEVSRALKILECCLHQRGINSELCAKGRGMKKRSIENREELKTLIVKNAVGKTYADTLKSIKTIIKPEESGATIKKVARTKDGNIVIKMRDEAPGATAQITEAINKGAPGSAEVKKDPKMQVLIHDLDGITETDEIEEAIRTETGEQGEILINEPMPSKNGCWTAKALVPKRCGLTLLQGRNIKIGWTNSRITEKISIPICYNCLKLGHLGNTCPEPRFPHKRCYKCASKEHEAGDCKAEPRCNECSQPGHTVNSFECPKYRQLIQERMSKNRNRTIEHAQRTNHD